MRSYLSSARTRLVLFVAVLIALLAVGPLTGQQQTTKAAAGEVLILDSTISGGAGSREAAAIVAAGKTPVIVNAATWGGMTAAQFASYDGIVLGDPTCTTDAGTIAAAVANANVWGPVIDGNVIVIGSDPVYHAGSRPGALTLINQGIDFSVDEAGKTGAYLDLSCIYHFQPGGTPVPVLDGLNGGGFIAIGANYLPGLNDVHIVATHPALGGLADADLSNWGNSVHNGFNAWPGAFEVLAIARDAGGSHVAPDGTRGYPYILARGEDLVVLSDIDLSPDDAVNPVGNNHTVTATVTVDDPIAGTPVVGTLVSFEVISGPNAGDNGTDTTDAAGQASFTYTGDGGPGVDTIVATFIDAAGLTQTSNKVTKEWIAERRDCLTDVTWNPVGGSFVTDPTPVAFGPAGTFTFDAKMTNVGTDAIFDLVSPVVTLSPDNRILNYPESPATVGDVLTLPLLDDYSDGVLLPGEMATFTFEVGLDPKAPFNFFVDLSCQSRPVR